MKSTNVIYWILNASNDYWCFCGKLTSNQIRVNKSLLVEGVHMRENWELFLQPNSRITIRSSLSFYQARNVLGFFCYYCVQRGFLWRENSTECFAIILVQLVPAISKTISSSVSLTTSTSLTVTSVIILLFIDAQENWWWDIVISRAMATVNLLRMTLCVKKNKQ